MRIKLHTCLILIGPECHTRRREEPSGGSGGRQQQVAAAGGGLRRQLREDPGGGRQRQTRSIFVVFLGFLFSRAVEICTRTFFVSGCAMLMEKLDFRRPFRADRAEGPHTKTFFGPSRKNIFLLIGCPLVYIYLPNSNQIH
jgi:hypothetical protein